MAYDEKLLYYFKTIEEVQALPKFKEIEFINLSMRSVCESISNHSREWMKCLGNQLNESAKKSLTELKSRLDVSIFTFNSGILACKFWVYFLNFSFINKPIFSYIKKIPLFLKLFHASF